MGTQTQETENSMVYRKKLYNPARHPDTRKRKKVQACLDDAAVFLFFWASKQNRKMHVKIMQMTLYVAKDNREKTVRTCPDIADVIKNI